MPTFENCCLYLSNPVDPRAVFNGGEIVRTGKNTSMYQYNTAEGIVGLNMSLTKHFPDKLLGIKGWVYQLTDPEAQKQKAYRLIDSIQMILGVILPGPISEESSAFDSFMYLIQNYGGFLFVHDSILTLNEGYLVGPAAYMERYFDMVDGAYGRNQNPPPNRASQPVQAKPVQAKPVQAKPVQAKPVQAQPVQAQPVQAKPVQAKPVQAKPVQAKPVQAQPVQAKPVQAQPVQAKPVQAKPVQAKPVQAKPVQAQPVQAQPVQAQPVQAKPVQAKPVQAQPVQAQPVQAQPVQAQPVQAQPVQAKPVQAKPVQAKPVQAKPVQAKPVQARPISDSNQQGPPSASRVVQYSVEPNKDQIYANVPAQYRKIREQNLALLQAQGFHCRQTLPIKTKAALRPVSDIAHRLMALYLLYEWVADHGQSIPKEELNTFLTTNELPRWFTPEELSVLQQNRKAANAEYPYWIAWKLENIWALAWVCGFKPEPIFYQGQANKTVLQLLVEYLPPLRGEIKGFVKFAKFQRATDVFVQEDLFRCTHSAVANAQSGNMSTVPAGYDPIADGSAVAERRHALSWCLSPGVRWENTDLST